MASRGLGHDLRQARERLAAADSRAGPPVSIATLLGEGFLPSAVMQAVVERLRYSPLWLRFEHPNTQRAFVADSVDKSRTAFTCITRILFIIMENFRVVLLLSDVSKKARPVEHAVAATAAFSLIIAFSALVLEVLAIITQVYSYFHSPREQNSPLGLEHSRADEKCQRGMSIRRNNIDPFKLNIGGKSPSMSFSFVRVVGWAHHSTRLYYITSEVSGLAVTLIPLVTMAQEYAISRDGGCEAGLFTFEDAQSLAHRVFYCRFIVRPFIATAISFSMITRSPQFPLVLLSSGLAVLVMILRSFSVLSDPDVPSVLRVFQFLMVLILVLAHVVFRWVVDRAVLDEYVNRRTVEAHAEQLRFENAALEAFAAEKYPQLRLRVEHGRSRRASTAAHSPDHGASTVSTSPAAARHEFSNGWTLGRGVVSTQETNSTAGATVAWHTFSTHYTSVETSRGALSDLLAARDYCPTAVVVAVRLHDFARFGHRHGVRTATSTAAASVLARVHEVVCGVEGSQPDVTERHWDTYIAVFGLLCTDGDTTDAAKRRHTLQRNALHGAQCMAEIAALDEQLQRAEAEPSVPALGIALHVGAVLGEYPGTSVSAQRYCHRGPGIDGALAMLASCRSPNEMILLSREAIAALDTAIADEGAADTIYEVQVHGDRFGTPPEAVIRVHSSVGIELEPPVSPPYPPYPHQIYMHLCDEQEHTVTSRTDVNFLGRLSSEGVITVQPRTNDIDALTTRACENITSSPAYQPTGSSLNRLLSQGSLSTLIPNVPARTIHHAALSTTTAHQIEAFNNCLKRAFQVLEDVGEGHRQHFATETTLSCKKMFKEGATFGLLPLRFSDPSVEHRFRDHFHQCGVLRLPNRVLDGFFLFIGMYTLIDFFVGVPFWDRHAAASFGQADELRLFSPKHVAALVLLLLWEALTLAGAVVRYRQRPVAWANIEASVPGGVLVQFLHDTWNALLLSHTVRYTLFAIILLLFQPSTFSMNPSYATIIGIGAFYLEPIPQHHDLFRLFFRFGVPNGIIFGMCFLQPLYLVDLFIGSFVALWPIAALVGRLSQDRMDRAAFVVTERATAYREALGKQQHLREQVLDTAATPAMRQLLSTVHDAAMATASEKGDADVKGYKNPPREGGNSIYAATRGPQMRGIPLNAASGRPAAIMRLELTIVIGVRFDPLPVPHTHPIVSGEVATALACAQRAECFAAFLAVLDAIVEKHPPLSVIEARGELVMLGGPWGAWKASAGGNDEVQYSQQHYAATALAFLADLRAAASAMPHYGTAFTLTTAATAEDALVLMRSALYPSADLLGPGPERVMTLLRAAVPGASATTAALHRIARNPTSFAREAGLFAASHPSGETSAWAVRDGSALVRVF